MNIGRRFYGAVMVDNYRRLASIFCLRSRAAESVFGPGVKKCFRRPPPVRADRLKMFTLNLKDELSVIE